MIRRYKRSILIHEFHPYFPHMWSPPRQINHRRHQPVPLRYFEIMSLPWTLCSRTSQAGNQAEQWFSPKKKRRENTTFLLVVSVLCCFSCFSAPGGWEAAACCSQDPAYLCLNVLRCWRWLFFSRALGIGGTCSCHGCCGCLGIHPRDAKLYLTVGRKPASHQAWHDSFAQFDPTMKPSHFQTK